MAILIYCDDPDLADEFAKTLTQAGYQAEWSQEPGTASDAGDTSAIVTTDAPAEMVGELIKGSDAFVEITDPMSGTKAQVAADDLPEQPE